MFYGYKKLNGSLIWGEAKSKEVLEKDGFSDVSDNPYIPILKLIDAEPDKYIGYTVEGNKVRMWTGDRKELEKAGCLGIHNETDSYRNSFTNAVASYCSTEQFPDGLMPCPEYAPFEADTIFSFIPRAEAAGIKETDDGPVIEISDNADALSEEGCKEIIPQYPVRTDRSGYVMYEYVKSFVE